MIYKDEDIKVGTKIICKDNDGCRWWKKDKVYEVVESKIYDNICIIDEEGDEQYLRGIILRLNGRARVKFELIKEVNKMKYTENDLESGDKLLCTKSEVEHWTLGKMYELKLNKLGVLEIKDDDGDEAYSSYILESLNKEWDLVEFELIKEENKMQEYKRGYLQEGMLLKCISTKTKDYRWIVGKTYEIKKHDNGLIYLTDENGYNWHEDAILNFLSKNDLFNTKLEIVKEGKKMNEFKVGDLVEVVKNNSHAYKNIRDLYEAGDKAIVTEVVGLNVRIGYGGFGNLIGIKEIKKVEPELTEYEEELVLRLAEAINRKDNYIKEIEELKYKITELEAYHELVEKEVKIYSKKLLTK